MRATATILVLLAFPALARAQDAPPGALACTGCHGVFDGAPYPIHQLGADEIVSSFKGFRDGTREGTIMPRFATAFTDSEVREIAEWFVEQGDAQ